MIMIIRLYEGELTSPIMFLSSRLIEKGVFRVEELVSLLIHSFIHLLTHALTHSLAHSLTHPFIHPSIHPFIHLLFHHKYLKVLQFTTKRLFVVSSAPILVPRPSDLLAAPRSSALGKGNKASQVRRKSSRKNLATLLSPEPNAFSASLDF